MTGEAVLKLTASFGIAQLGDGDSASALLRRADAKLYEAKRNGRNQIVIERSKVAA
jgi:PleD family two-component response regulator